MATKKPKDEAPEEQPQPTIKLRRLEKQTYEIPLVGRTPLIIHKWSEKALRMMREKQSGSAARPKKDPKVPEQEAEEATYFLPDGRPGFPATGFKAAMVHATRSFEGITLVAARTMFFVWGEGPEQLVAIEGTRTIREDTPRIGMGTTDLRYRPAFFPWSATIRVTFKPAQIDLESVLALLNEGGDGGIGEWRPQAPKSLTGTFGTFDIDLDGEIKQVRE